MSKEMEQTVIEKTVVDSYINDLAERILQFRQKLIFSKINEYI